MGKPNKYKQLFHIVVLIYIQAISSKRMLDLMILLILNCCATKIFDGFSRWIGSDGFILRLLKYISSADRL